MQFRFGKLGVRGAGRMDDKGFDVRDVRQKRENLQAVDQCLRLPRAALDVAAGRKKNWRVCNRSLLSDETE